MKGEALITILQPDPKVILDRFGGWFQEMREEFRVVELFKGVVPQMSDCGDGIVILGGTMDALNVDAAPWLEDLHRLLRDAQAANVPVLGICLGHQIIADCFGGEVVVGAGSIGEHGARRVMLNEAGKKDPLLGVLHGTCTLAEQHNDAVVRLPEGAELLASSDACPVQAFRLGTLVGVQFHPEASPELMEFWSLQDGGQAGVVEDEMRSVDDEIASNGRAIARTFVECVRRF